MVATSCDLNAPCAPPKSRGYVCTGPGEVTSLVIDPPDPGDPPLYLKKEEV